MLNKKVMIVSLGCDKNLVDTEKMLGILADEGCTFTDDEAQAQVIIVNTCCFIGDAKEESIQNILDLARFKTEGKLEALIATGCLSQRYQDEMLEELPELDGILGISAWHTIADVVREALEGKRPRNLMSTGVLNSHTTKRLLTTGGHYAYLKIAEGCNKRCTYCVIPSVRGAYVSVPMEELEKEARELLVKRMKEVVEKTAEVYRGSATIEMISEVPPLICDSELTKEVVGYMKELGIPNLIPHPDVSSSASEDFAVIAEKVPSSFLYLSAGYLDERGDYPAHHPKVQFNEEVCPIGAGCLAHCARRWLEEH